MTKRLILAGWTVLAAGAVWAATLNEPCDLATLTPSDYETIYCKASSTNTSYTLSADVSWGSQTLSVGAGSMIFDFSDGGHTLGIKSFFIDSASSPYVELKGGVWDGLDLKSYGELRLNKGDNTSSDRTIVLDDVSISTIRRVHLLRGRNGTLELKNGASLTATEFWPLDAIDDVTFTNNLIWVHGGSTLGKTTNGDCNWEDGGNDTATLMNNRLLVEGVGSTFIGNMTYNVFHFGRYTSGNSILVKDGGSVQWYSATVGGSANSKSNTVEVTGAGSSIIGGGSLKIGTAVGADYNRVVVADGADLKTQSYNGTWVGEQGSFNELIISNATLSRTYWVTAGMCPGASNNAVRVCGTSSITPTGSYHFFFGAGQNNLFSFEGGSFYPSTTIYGALSTFDKEKKASTNNTLQVVNGATLRLYNMNAHVSSVSNTIFVGAGSVLQNTHDMHIRGFRNNVVVSNGMVTCTQSFPGFCMGSRDTDETDGYLEGENKLVLQGDCPVVKNYDPAVISTVHLCDHATLRIEVPEKGYKLFEQDGGDPTNAPLFQKTGVYLYGSPKLEVVGVEEHARQLTQERNYCLLDTGYAVVNPDPGVSDATVLAAANAALPRGSCLYKVSNQLWLRVRPYRGMLMLVR